MDVNGSPLAFYDFDGTLVSSNIVTQYAWYIRQHPSRLTAARKLAKLLVSVPVLLGLESYSRRRLNEVFYREYRGLREDWLRGKGEELLREVLGPATYPGARRLVAADRAAGFHAVLVTGSPDFAIQAFAGWFGFERVIANSLVFENGVATGEIVPPVIAGEEKVAAMRRMAGEYNVGTEHCKAYTDSFSDLPMLEAVGMPAAVNPGRRLRRVADRRGWPVIDLKASDHVDTD